MARWLQVIGEYNFTIVHRAGRSHGNADGLSRKECSQCGRDERPHEVVNNIAEMVGEVPAVGETTVRAVTSMPLITCEKMMEAQLEDMSIKWMFETKKRDAQRPDWKTISSRSSAEKTYWRLWDQLAIKENVLSRRWESDDVRLVKWHTILPEKFRADLVKELHGGVATGHLGVKKTMAKVRARFYWCGMAADIRSIIRQCNVCAKRKSPAKTKKAPLQQHIVGAPMERVALDIMGPLPETPNGNKYILVVGDYLTKWMEVYPVPDQTAETVAKKFVNEYVCRFGVPEVLHSNQGRNFESRVFAEMCDILGIEKTRTCPYNPKSDGMVERFNRTLITMVAMMIEPNKRQRDWDEKLPLATIAYRATPQESTGESPNMLMLGRELRLPIDLTTEMPGDDEDDIGAVETDYACELRLRMRAAQGRARKCLKQSVRRQKAHYDRRTIQDKLQPGNFVWLHNPAKRKGLSPKLQCRWEGPYLITHKLSDILYRIQRSH